MKIDLTGCIFEKLVVMKRSKSDKAQVFWECECECGETRIISTGELRSGRRKSCGCLKKQNLAGMKFGKLMVVCPSDTKNSKRMWKCKCDCGNIVVVDTSRLRSKHTTSCGCAKAAMIKNKLWKGCGDISGSFWARVVLGAKSRGLEFKITIKDIWDLFLEQKKKCKLSGLPLRFGSKATSSDATASLDRIDSNLGYVIGNIQWIHKDINQMKMAFDQKYFLKICKKITEHMS